MKINRVTIQHHVGLGTALKTVIHAGVDLAPLPAAAKQAIKSCGSCASRAARLDAAVPNINPLSSAEVSAKP